MRPMVYRAVTPRTFLRHTHLFIIYTRARAHTHARTHTPHTRAHARCAGTGQISLPLDTHTHTLTHIHTTRSPQERMDRTWQDLSDDESTEPQLHPCGRDMEMEPTMTATEGLSFGVGALCLWTRRAEGTATCKPGAEV